MSLSDFNFKCSNTQQQEEFFVETNKNAYQSSSPNFKNQNGNQFYNPKNYLNSSALFSKSSSQDNHEKISSHLIKRTQNVRRSFQDQVEAKHFNEQWNKFQQTSEYFIKMAREEKKQKLCQKKTQVSESNNSKKIYEVMILSLIIGYFAAMVYIIFKEFFSDVI